MDTVKIDIQKLQLLNDRISQTIDALNQVRVSTHGLQHSSGQIGASQIGAAPWGQPQLGVGIPFAGYPQQQLGASAFYGQPQALPIQAMGAGLEHTTPTFINPAASAVGLGPVSQGPLAYASRGMGISHTAPVVDPYGQMRAQVTFPFAQYAFPPMMAY